jgi:DNA (cytosine-5)-methyltransferase 1
MWPTPRANSGNGAGKHGEGGMDLQTAVALANKGLWPTPTVSGNYNRKGASKNSGDGLETAVSLAEGKLWPTLSATGMCGGTGNWERLKEKCTGIEEARQMGAGNGGKLNPNWEEALMGYPLGWTDIDVESPVEADYPARWLDGTWEEGIPRVINKIKNRGRRIRCIGNAVVPQIPAVLWMMIMVDLW